MLSDGARSAAEEGSGLDVLEDGAGLEPVPQPEKTVIDKENVSNKGRIFCVVFFIFFVAFENFSGFRAHTKIKNVCGASADVSFP